VRSASATTSAAVESKPKGVVILPFSFIER
jgi:hypothetical protein